MKRFRAFLFEANFEHHISDGNDAYTHTGTVSGKEIDTHFNKRPSGGYRVDFSVDGDFNKPAKAHKNAGEVMAHVAHTVHRFVREKKPARLHFVSSDAGWDAKQKKTNMYYKFAQHLADTHGGRVENQGHRTTIHFA